MIKKMLNKRIKNLIIDKFKLEIDVKSKKNNVIVWVSSNDNNSIQKLIELHYTVRFNLLLIIYLGLCWISY